MARTKLWTDEEARQLGEHHGYNAANYAANVSGEDLDLLSPEARRPLSMTPQARMFYDDGFDTGIDNFKLSDDLSDWPEFALLAG